MNEKLIENLMELTQKKIISIKHEGQNTLIEFEDGEILPLFGVTGTINEKIEVPSCSFCGREQSKNFPLIAPPNRDNPMICSICSSKAVEAFIQHGIEVELDISNFPQEIKEKFINFGKDKE